MNELKPEDVMRALDEISKNENLKQYSGIPFVAEKALALLREKDAEIEKQKAVKKIATDNNHQCYRLGYEDAINKFAELWKKWWYGQIEVSVNAYQESIIYDAIDKIAKEMKGETDGRKEI